MCIFCKEKHHVLLNSSVPVNNSGVMICGSEQCEFLTHAHQCRPFMHGNNMNNPSSNQTEEKSIWSTYRSVVSSSGTLRFSTFYWHGMGWTLKELSLCITFNHTVILTFFKWFTLWNILLNWDFIDFWMFSLNSGKLSLFINVLSV